MDHKIIAEIDDMASPLASNANIVAKLMVKEAIATLLLVFREIYKIGIIIQTCT
ncbi:hypothetical protein VcTj87_12240 [Vibrio comitans]